MSILSTNKRLIKVGQDYSAGSGISIDDGVISVTGEFGKTYSAGDNIDIYEQGEQLYISSKDWEQDIANASANAYNEAVAQIPDPFDPSYLSAQIDNKLNSSDFTTWQNGQYTTDLQTIEGQINNKLDTSSFSDVSGSFLTAHQSLDGYATEDWVTAQGYITGVDLSPYYTTAEANSLSSILSGAIDYVSANADNVEVTNVVQSNSGVWNKVTNKLDATAFSNVSGSFYTNDNPSGFITGVDLSNYYTKDETSGKEELANAFDNIPVGDPEVNAYVTDNSATINGTTDLVQNSSGLWNDVAVYQSNSANYLTAHQDISYKLDESAFADVSGTFLTAHQSLDGYATVEDVESATSGKANISSTVPLVDSFSSFVLNTDYIGAVADKDGNFYQIVKREGEPQSAWYVRYTSSNIERQIISNLATGPWTSDRWSISPYEIYSQNGFSISPSHLGLSGASIVPSSHLTVNNVVTAYPNGITANGLSADSNGFTANGISAGPNVNFCIQGGGELLESTYGNGFIFSSRNITLGTARLTVANAGPIVQMYSPKFEARNISGAGFCIEASGARGYDHNGNVTWDTTKAPSPEQLIAGADSPKPTILLSPYMPKSMSAQWSNAPLFSADGNGIYIGISGQNIRTNMAGTTARNGQLRVEISDNTGVVTGYTQINGGDVTVYHSTAFGSAGSGTWILTQSVQKREIEYDADTSAITAIAGSAIGGGGVTGEFVPQSAFDELKASYDALSSLFATYSGQWLLPNEGEE